MKIRLAYKPANIDTPAEGQMVAVKVLEEQGEYLALEYPEVVVGAAEKGLLRIQEVRPDELVSHNVPDIANPCETSRLFDWFFGRYIHGTYVLEA